jgi:hypothetical protein
MSDSEPSDVVNEHAVLIGRVAIAWNDLSDVLGRLFEALTGMTAEMARAVLFSNPSDRAQRLMVASAAAIILADNGPLRERLMRSIKEVDALAAERNAAIHTSWVAEIYTTGPATNEIRMKPSSGVVRHKKLRDDFEQQFEDLKAKIQNKFWELEGIYKEVVANS